jgi:hypothetical protein
MAALFHLVASSITRQNVSRSVAVAPRPTTQGLQQDDVEKYLRSAGSFAHVSSKSGKNTSSMVSRRFVNPCS